jgi:hypothetical protein
VAITAATAMVVREETGPEPENRELAHPADRA